MTEAVYGAPPLDLAAPGAGAVQLSPLIPGAEGLEDIAGASLDRFVVLGPPGTLERRHVLAHALRTLKPGGELIALAPKTKGGTRLSAELTAFGCQVVETARRHHRICQTIRPEAPTGLDAAIAEGASRRLGGDGLWTQPGVFSWDRLDPGTALLLAHASGLAGKGADLGCGIGILALKALETAKITEIACLDIDRRAIAAAAKNIADPRARFLHRDVRQGEASLEKLDFVIMNPPFHDGGREDRGLGLAFITAAARMLRRGGVCRLVANVALPYEARLAADFSRSTVLVRAGGYKVYEAIK